MNVLKVKSKGPSAPMAVASPGATSAVGHRAPKFKAPTVRPQAASTRSYGKQDAPPAPTPSPNPFGFDGGM